MVNIFGGGRGPQQRARERMGPEFLHNILDFLSKPRFIGVDVPVTPGRGIDISSIQEEL
jgi:hypothetical protein